MKLQLKNKFNYNIQNFRNFLIVDNTSIWIYTYTGRLHLNPRYPGSQAQIFHLNNKCISMGMDSLAVRDHADQTGSLTFKLNLIIRILFGNAKF